MDEDLILWNKIKEGDINAFKGLYDKYYYQLCLYAQKLYRSTEYEDAVSDCFIKLWERKDALFIDRSIKMYLFLMLKNSYLDSVRKNKKEQTGYIEDCMIDIPDEDMLQDFDRYAELYKIVEKLPEQRLRILNMAIFDSLSYAQIAEKLGISINTVKTQLGRAYKFLREELSKKSFYH